MELVRADVARDPFLVAQDDLADEHALAVAVGELAPAAIEGMDLRLVDRVLPVETLCCAGPHDADAFGLVAEQPILEQGVRDVDPEAVDAAVEPETEDVLEVGLDLR